MCLWTGFFVFASLSLGLMEIVNCSEERQTASDAGPRRWKFVRIWPDEYTKAIDTGLVLTAKLRKVQDVATVLSMLNKIFPLPELRHLKRVRHVSEENCHAVVERGNGTPRQAERVAEIIITYAAHEFGNVLSSAEFLSSHEAEALIPYVCDSLMVRSVSQTKPLTRQQFDASRALWATVSPNPFVCVDKDSLPANQRCAYSFHLEELVKLVPDGETRCCSTNRVRILDTRSDVRLIFADDQTDKSVPDHELHHPLMKAIAEISKCRTNRTSSGKRKADQSQDPVRGTEFEEGTTWDEAVSYLCTGYDILVLAEPCIMCGMALVHARAGRVVFLHDSPLDGSLKSVYKLQGVSSLNHRFEVWQAVSVDRDATTSPETS